MKFVIVQPTSYSKLRARCAETSRGVLVILEKRVVRPKDAQGWLIWSGTMDAPFHVVLDRIHDLLLEMAS